ncbi:MAG: transglycosylase SLT domain-containing protein, partial [Burkholderiales bacterium]
PYKSIDAAASYLSDNLKKFNGRYDLAAAGYNWGEHRKQLTEAARTNSQPRWLPAETRNYLASIEASTRKRKADQYTQPVYETTPQAGDFTPDPGAYDAIISEVMRSAGIDEETAAKYLQHPEGKKRYPLPEPYASIVKAGSQKPQQNAPNALQAIQQRAGVITTAPPSNRQPIASAKAQVNFEQQKITTFQARLNEINTQFNRLTENRKNLISKGYDGQSLEPLDNAIIRLSQERASLQGEIQNLGTKKAPRVEELQSQLAQFEQARNAAQQAAARSANQQEQSRLYSEAQQWHGKARQLKSYIENERQGKVAHPLLRDAAIGKAVVGKADPTTWEQIQGGVGAGAAGFTSGLMNLGANLYEGAGLGKASGLRENANKLNEYGQISMARTGGGLIPELTSAGTQAALAFLPFAGIGRLGAAGAARLGVPEVVGESAALGAYGALEHGHEGLKGMTEGALLNAALPLANRALSSTALPTRLAGNFAAGFIPSAAMQYGDSGAWSKIDLNAALSQGLIGGALGARGKQRPAVERETTLPTERTLTNDNPLTTPESLQRAKMPYQFNPETPAGQIAPEIVANPQTIKDAVSVGYEVIQHSRPTGENDYYLKSPANDVLHPLAPEALMELARNRYQPLDVKISAGEQSRQRATATAAPPPAGDTPHGKYQPIDVNISTENPRGTKYAPPEGKPVSETPPLPPEIQRPVNEPEISRPVNQPQKNALQPAMPPKVEAEVMPVPTTAESLTFIANDNEHTITYAPKIQDNDAA